MIRTFNNLIVNTRKELDSFFKRVLSDEGNEVVFHNGKTYNTIIDDVLVEVKPLKLYIVGSNVFLDYEYNGIDEVERLEMFSLDEVIHIGEVLMDEIN